MWIGWLFIVIGLYTTIGLVIFNLGMNTRRAQRMVKFIGVTGAKIFYTIIGIGCLVYGILVLMGIIVIS